MKKILALFVSMMLVLTLSVAGTAAYAVLDLTSMPAPVMDVVVDNNKNEIQDATLFDGMLWEPGYMDVAYIRLSSEGRMMYEIKIDGVGSEQQLAAAIDVYLIDCTHSTTAIDRNMLKSYQPCGTLAEVMENNRSLLAQQEADGSKIYAIVLKMRENVGNDYQGTSASFTVTVRATQVNNT